MNPSVLSALFAFAGAVIVSVLLFRRLLTPPAAAPDWERLGLFDPENYRPLNRLLDPVTTIHTFLTQILHGNVACSELPHLTGLAFTATAYCQARARLPRQHFDDLSCTA